MIHVAKLMAFVGIQMHFVCAGSLSLAAPGIKHDKFANLLLGTPPEQGGCSGLTERQLETVNDWIDNPATRIGKTVDKATNQSLSPSNHGYQRHNPFNVAKAMSGQGEQGKDFLAHVNAARMHKILDVAENSAPVDGWEITPTMRAEAKSICEYVESNKRLPRELPSWVDYRGIDGVNNPVKLTQARELNREILTKLRQNQLQDYELDATRALKELPTESRRKFAIAKLSEGTSRLVGRALVVVNVALLAYDGYRVYADDVSWLDVADENIEGFLASAELVNYPLLEMDNATKAASGGWVRLSDLVRTTARMPSPEETDQMITTLRKIKNVVVTDPRTRAVAHYIDEIYRDEMHSRIGTPKNTLRTIAESPVSPTPPVGLKLLLDWILPRDERPKDAGAAAEKDEIGRK